MKRNAICPELQLEVHYWDPKLIPAVIYSSTLDHYYLDD